MKWWYWLILELLIIFGVIAWIYFFPSEIEEDFAKGMVGFVLFYAIENCKDINRRKTMSENYTIEQNCGENRIEGGVLSVSGSVSEKHTCKECVGETVFKGKKAYCKNRNCDLPACDNFKPKKEKHYRPFSNCDELIEVFQKKCDEEIGCTVNYPSMYKTCVWVKHKEYGTEFLITAFDNRKDLGTARLPCVYIQDMWVDFEELFELYTFLDGSPCGILES